MPSHKTLTDPELHEPKGVSSATNGQLYVADGNGSGSWSPVPSTGKSHQGFGQYQDNRRTEANPAQVIASGERALFVNNGNFLTKERLPIDAIEPLWDVVNNKHNPISEDDTYDIRLSFTAEGYSGTNSHLLIELDIGGTLGVIVSEAKPLLRSGEAQAITLSIPVFTASTYINNGGEFYLTYAGTGSVNIHSNSIFIERRSKVNQ